MENALVSWIISLVSGGAGGNVIGALLKEKSLGPTMNSILGAVGGALGGQILPLVLEGLQSSGALGNIGSSAVGGIVLPLIVSFLKKR
jgi:uncharacterized membrane protein YeaQ/YmgE (transglycosylase-associated protein family)